MVRSHWLRVYDMQLDALFRLAFTPAPELLFLSLAAYRNSQVYSTKDTPQTLPPVTSCRSMVSGSISLPSPGFFSPFPHGTSALSVAGQYLALDRGRPGFRQGSTCPALLRYRIMESSSFRVRVCHPLRPVFPDDSATMNFSLNSTGHPHAALQPRLKRFGLFPVRSPLLRDSQLISLPGLLRWFTSPSVALPSYFIQTLQCMNHFIRVTPFGNPRITGYVLLPAAFRSLSRPSSPAGSKASAMDLYSLDHITFLPPELRFYRSGRLSSTPAFTRRSPGSLLYKLLVVPFPSNFKEHFFYGD